MKKLLFIAVLLVAAAGSASAQELKLEENAGDRFAEKFLTQKATVGLPNIFSSVPSSVFSMTGRKPGI